MLANTDCKVFCDATAEQQGIAGSATIADRPTVGPGTFCRTVPRTAAAMQRDWGTRNKRPVAWRRDRSKTNIKTKHTAVLVLVLVLVLVAMVGMVIAVELVLGQEADLEGAEGGILGGMARAYLRDE